MSRRSIPTLPSSPKDANGAYLPETKHTTSSSSPVDPPDRTENIDAMLKDGLSLIYLMLRTVRINVSGPTLERADVQNLKDIMAMLSDLKEKERDILEEMDDEQLKKAAE
jgi:hypothetical protein